MKCMENMTLHEMFYVVSRFPCYISCYILENQFPFEQCMVCGMWSMGHGAWGMGRGAWGIKGGA